MICYKDEFDGNKVIVWVSSVDTNLRFEGVVKDFDKDFLKLESETDKKIVLLNIKRITNIQIDRVNEKNGYENRRIT